MMRDVWSVQVTLRGMMGNVVLKCFQHWHKTTVLLLRPKFLQFFNYLKLSVSFLFIYMYFFSSWNESTELWIKIFDDFWIHIPQRVQLNALNRYFMVNPYLKTIHGSILSMVLYLYCLLWNIWFWNPYKTFGCCINLKRFILLPKLRFILEPDDIEWKFLQHFNKL